LYQWVFCPLTNQVVNLTAPDAEVVPSEMLYLGEQVPSHIAMGVALGDLHPRTKMPIVVQAKDRSHSKPLRQAARSLSSATTQTPDMKNSKPIDSFFKPRRTPLAELDPNSFTPSPSQQRLLQQNSGNGWAPVLAPHPQSLQRTAPQSARRVLSDSYTSRFSAPNPSKRQRLCSDDGFGTPGSASGSVESSRFFASSLIDPSPSLRTSKKLKTKPADDVNIWSDDSIDDAMAELAELEEVAPQPKKIKVFREKGVRSSSYSISQSTTTSRSSALFSQESADTLTPASSCSSPEPATDLVEETSVFSAALSAQVKDIRARFSYTTSAKSTHAPPNPLPQIACPTTIANSSRVVSVTTMRKSFTDVSTQIVVGETDVAHTPPEVGKEVLDPILATMEGDVVIAASDTESPVAQTSSRRLDIKGSEDLLVPESEAESDCSPRKSNFSLQRYAFAG